MHKNLANQTIEALRATLKEAQERRRAARDKSKWHWKKLRDTTQEFVIADLEVLDLLKELGRRQGSSANEPPYLKFHRENRQ